VNAGVPPFPPTGATERAVAPERPVPPGAARDPRASILLVARELEVSQPGARDPAVRGVTLTVGSGEWVALTGPNGGGKTTALLALAGLWPISGGTLTLDGVPFGPRDRVRAARGVSVVLQDPSSQLLQPTVREELAFTARNLGLPEPQVTDAVARWSAGLDLVSELDRAPASLSAGRQQLVLLAAALVARPRLLLADEPTAHLDAASRARVRTAIAAEVASGLAVVWATQDPSEVAAATRTLAIGAVRAPGRRPAIGTPARAATVALRLRVAPDPGGEGPGVRVALPLEIAVGDRGVTALLGPNGVGKSVLLAAAAGLPAPGQVLVKWESTRTPAPIVALQFPELQIFEERVSDEVVFAAVARGVRRPMALEAASRCLNQLGFDARALLARASWSLSAGEKRLVEVVGALIAPSSLVLLDEPTAGVDEWRRDVLALLVLERAASVPVLLASQDREWVESLGAHTVVVGS
jgi:energy-coupling factor transport system ATP-binding protein